MPSRPAARRTRRTRSAVPHSGTHARSSRPPARVLRRTGRSSLPPSEQLRPTTSGFACRTEFQNASVTWPVRVRPDASVIVPEIITGQRRPCSSNSVSMAKIAALLLSVSKIVSMTSRSAPPSTSPRACSRYASTIVSKSMLRAPGSLTSGEIDPVRFSGPMAPAAHRGLVGRACGHRVARLASEPRSGDIHLVRVVLHAVVGERDALGVEGVGLDDVGAGLEVGVVDLADEVRLGQHEQVVVALDVAGPVGEALAAELLLLELVALHHRAHRAVDDEQPLLERGAELVGRVGTVHACHATGGPRRIPGERGNLVRLDTMTGSRSRAPRAGRVARAGVTRRRRRFRGLERRRRRRDRARWSISNWSGTLSR